MISRISKKADIKALWVRLWNTPLLFSFLSSFVLTLVIEALSRHNVFGGFIYLWQHPGFFTLNCLIIAACMSLGYFAPKRIFAHILTAFVFLVLGIVNCVLLYTRVNPFEAVDLSILRTGISIVNVYLSVFEIILCAAAILGGIFGIVLLFIKTPKSPRNNKKTVITTVITVTLAALCITLSSVFSFIPNHLTDINDAYDKYGFTYCFARSIFDRGIAEPEDYSEYTIDEILSSIGSDKTDESSDKPNIIFVQLESFMDMSYFNNLTFETNPTPNFTFLKDNYTSGKLLVPSVGSGTANTEFEVLTGMNLDYFGTGEYPFKTVLKNHSCESVCYDLKELGYSAHSFHNHTGTFYDRNVAYQNLGFDDFTPIEYMSGFETNPMGWAKDYILKDEIMKALESTDGSDFVFSVSVQGHGKYPTEPVEGEGLIPVTGIEDEQLRHQYEYFAYQLSETDKFIGNLVEALSECGEDCVLVLYGDHQPSIEYTLHSISLYSKHESEYVVWTSFESEPEHETLESYQLYSYVLGRLGINNGILTKLHQNYSENDDYQSALETLEYDMLYGDMLSYDSSAEYIPAQMKLGIDTVSVTGVNEVSGSSYIIGENFTEWSRVEINGHSKSSVYISDGVLLLDGYTPESGDKICVKQVTDDFVELGKTDDYIYKAPIKSDNSLNTEAED